MLASIAPTGTTGTHPMARPRSIQPDIRYRGELKFWTESIAAIKAGAPIPILECLTRNEAISARHKLNMARAFYRDQTHFDQRDQYVGDHPWNHFTVKMEGLNIFIAEKQMFPWDQVKTANGLPYNAMPEIEVDTSKPLTDRELSIARQVQKLEDKAPMPPPPETHDHTKPIDIETIPDE